MARLSILVIEGDEGLARLFADMFRFHEWDADSFSDLSKATAALEGDKHYDLILISYRIVGSSGVELARMIRALEHRRRTPLVMLTGSPDVEEEALAAGVDEVLRKPVDMYGLVAAVQRHVKARPVAPATAVREMKGA